MCLAVSYGRKLKWEENHFDVKAVPLIIPEIQGKERLRPTANGNSVGACAATPIFVTFHVFMLAGVALSQENRSLHFFLLFTTAIQQLH